jgi:hypothetical protein
MSHTDAFEWKIPNSPILKGKTGETQNQEHAHNFILKGFFTTDLSWQVKQSIPCKI